ncbi:MAG: glycosyltransferase [Clostridia bacterium]|nr:glycosyltransferase [Clostridia bacterium]
MDFSVLMSVYKKDDPSCFEIAINSVLTQTIPPNEVVLVVDGPVPYALEQVINKFEKPNTFRVIRLSENKGLGEARRVGVQACTNDLIAVMDSDDIAVSQRFEIQLLEFQKDSELDIVGGYIEEFIESPENVVGKRFVALTDAQIKADLKKRCPMNHMTVMFKKNAVEAAGGYLTWHYNEDYYLWLRMALANRKFVNVSQTLVQVRVGEEMYQRRGGWKYFRSEAKLQKYMLDQKMIGFGTYVVNVSKRFAFQVLIPNKLRGFLYKKLLRG